jgi:hypothetical protein
MKKPKQVKSTILIGSLPLGRGNEIRVDLGPLGTMSVVNIRRWYVDKAGEWRPTRKGITIVVDQLDGVTSLLRKARKVTVREGLLPKKTRTE